MRKEVRTAVFWGALCTGILAVLIVVGSRNLSHFDAVLVAYTSAVLFSTFGIAYRYAMWLQRPPTAMYWRRGWQSFLRRGRLVANVALWPRRVFTDVLITRFIWSRGRLRGLTHVLIMWGCILAVLITFPLVFGWIHFASLPGRFDLYRAVLFGFPTFTFAIHSIIGFLLFHGLVWSSFLVIAGVMLAMRRRMRDEGAAAVQLFDEDFLPLILLFAVSLTGLMLTVSYTWMGGYGYDFIGLLHAITVIATFLWIPFGKFFHIFQRPAQLGVRFYKDDGSRGEPALCARCRAPFSSRLHVEDLIRVEQELGYRYEMPMDPVGHYQRICPPCRRTLFAMAQARLWRTARGEFRPAVGPERRPRPAVAPQPRPMPAYVNPGIGEGPLGSEDSDNFHP
jgi:hypothetical protein